MQATVNNLTFGWMTNTDAKTLVNTMKLVCKHSTGIINSLEIGVRRGETSRAIHQYFTEQGRVNFHTGIDNGHDVSDGSPFESCRFILGNSNEVFNQIVNDSQHFIFLDCNHSYPMVLSDFLCYSDKLRIGGYFAVHDTSPYIKSFTDYQNMGSKLDWAMYISCRKALKKLGLYENKFHGFEIVYDKYDREAPTGGVTVVKRIA